MGSRVSGGRQNWAAGQGKTQGDINGAIPGFRRAGRCSLGKKSLTLMKWFNPKTYSSEDPFRTI